MQQKKEVTKCKIKSMQINKLTGITHNDKFVICLYFENLCFTLHFFTNFKVLKECYQCSPMPPMPISCHSNYPVVPKHTAH